MTGPETISFADRCSSWLRKLALATVMLLPVGCASRDAAAPVPQTEASVAGPRDTYVIDCVVPPVVRRLNHQVVQLGASQHVQTSVKDCQARGGSWREAGAPPSSPE